MPKHLPGRPESATTEEQVKFEPHFSFGDEQMSSSLATISALANAIRYRGQWLKQVDDFQRKHLQEIDAALAGIDRRLDQSVGSLALGLPRPSFMTPRYEILDHDFAIACDEETWMEFAIPLDKITAHRANPYFYGTGHRAAPALDIRVQTSLDTVLSDGQPHPGQWFHLPLERIDMGIVA